MSGPVAVLVVGDPEDLHAVAVADRLASQGSRAAILIDAASLSKSRWRYSDNGFSIRDEAGAWQSPRRAWLRRLAPLSTMTERESVPATPAKWTPDCP